MATLQYNGVTLVDTNTYSRDGFDIGELRRQRPDGSILSEWGGLNYTPRMDMARQELTWGYSWGSVKCRYTTTADRLTLTLTVQNTHPTETVLGMSIYPMAVRFPNVPEGFDNYTPQVAFTTINPPVVKAHYGTAQLVLVNEDGTKPLYAGFWPTSETAGTRRYPLWISSAPLSYQPGFWTKLNRPLPPGQTDVYTISLRFAPPAASSFEVARDAYQAYASAWPFQLNWPDRRPIGSLHMSIPETGWPKNPRGWFRDESIDVTTEAGRADFHQRVLNYADESVSNLKNVNAQGAVVWDLEGEQHPHMISYIGDPRTLPTVAPEMVGVVDAFFKKFRDAGLRIGMLIRPQQFYLDSTGAHQDDLPDPAQQLIDKITYCKQRWGATLFYVDVNGSTLSAIDALIFKRVAEAHPDVLLLPEHQNIKYYAYTAPYDELKQGVTGTPADVASMWPSSFSVIYLGDGDVPPQRDKLIAAIRRGDIMMFRAWMTHDLPEVKDLYDAAGVFGNTDTTPPAVAILSPTAGAISGQVTATATATDNVHVSGVQFRIDGNPVGVEDITSPYTTILDTVRIANGSHALTALARDPSGNLTVSAPVTLTVSNSTLDSTPPSVGIVNPTGGVAVSGTVTVVANATDNVGVVGVQFKINGVNLGAEDTAAPYSIAWDTASAGGPGSHVLTAVARDTSGLTSTAAPLTVYVLGTLGAYWRLDETAGTTGADNTSNDNTLTLVGGAQWAPTAGRIGGALRLDGNTGFARAADSPSLRGNDFTVSLWFRTEDPNRLQTLVAKPTGQTFHNSIVLYLENGRLTAHTCCNTGFLSAGAINSTDWQHAAVVKAGTEMRLYLNGARAGTAGGAPPAVDYNDRTWLIGAENDTNGPQNEFLFRGWLDDIRIHSRALSDAEVTSLYNAAPAAPDTAAPTVALTSPASGAQVNGNVSVQASATDNLGVMGVQFRLNGAALGAEDTTAPYAITWNTTAVANGTHTLTAVARDAAGNTRTATVIQVNVNNAPPADTTAPTVPSNLTATAATSQVVLRWTASTDAVGVSGYRVYRNGAQIAIAQSLSYTDTSVLPATTYSYTVAAYDAAGNVSAASTAISVATPAPPPGNTAGLIGQWKFEEASGSAAADSSGNGLTATLANAPGRVAGRIGKGLSFNGGNQYAVIADSPLLDATRLTVSAWVYKSGDLPDYGMIAHRAFGDSYQELWALYYNNSGGDEYSFVVRTSSTQQVIVKAGSSGVDQNKWAHLVGTYDGSMVRLYRNGVLVGSAPLIGNIPPDNNVVSLGAGSNDNGRSFGERFKGWMDEVTLYDRALSAIEVKALYDSVPPLP